jgi:hypothetical protein
MKAENVQPIDRVKSEKGARAGITMAKIRQIVATDVVECGRSQVTMSQEGPMARENGTIHSRSFWVTVERFTESCFS